MAEILNPAGLTEIKNIIVNSSSQPSDAMQSKQAKWGCQRQANAAGGADALIIQIP